MSKRITELANKLTAIRNLADLIATSYPSGEQAQAAAKCIIETVDEVTIYDLEHRAAPEGASDRERIAKLSGLCASDDIVIQQDGGGIRITLAQVNEIVGKRGEAFESHLAAAIDALPLDAARLPEEGRPTPPQEPK